MNPSSSHQKESRFAWVLSLAFWICLLFAAGCYAGVALSPKFWTCLNLENDRVTNQTRLVILERQTQYLEKVAVVLKSGDELTAELARQDFQMSRPGEEYIPVEPKLSMAGTIPQPDQMKASPQMPWYAPVVRMLATDQKLRQNLLFTSAIIIVTAFTFLHPPIPAPLQKTSQPTGRPSPWKTIFRRYLGENSQTKV